MEREPDLLDELAELMGDHVYDAPFEEVQKTVDANKRVEHLERYARKVVRVEGLPEDAIIQFRKITLKRGNRIHSLLVDVLMHKKRYTAALKKRLSLGLRDPDKWIVDLNEAVKIAIEGKPVAWNSVENRLNDKARKRITIYGGEDYPECQVTLWRDTIVDARGPVEGVQEMLKDLLDEGEEHHGSQEVR
jgi:hypothetical protein